MPSYMSAALNWGAETEAEIVDASLSVRNFDWIRTADGLHVANSIFSTCF